MKKTKIDIKTVHLKLGVILLGVVLLSSCNEKKIDKQDSIDLTVKSLNSVTEAIKNPPSDSQSATNVSGIPAETHPLDPVEIFREDPLNAPLDLTSLKFKSYKGLYLEIDLDEEGRLYLSSESGRVRLSFKNMKLECDPVDKQPMWECLSIFSPFFNERLGPSGTRIYSFVFPVTDYDILPVLFSDGHSFQLDHTYKKIARYHLISEGYKTSIVLPPNYSPLKISALIYAKFPEPSSEIKDLDLLKAMLPSDLKNQDEYFLMKGKYLEGLSINNQIFYSNSDLIGKPVKPYSKPIEVDNGSSTSGDDITSYFKVRDYDFVKDIVRISDGDRDLYFKQADCETCIIRYFPQSSYENDLFDIELIRAKKIKHEVQELVENIQPCLASKDLKCIQSFFLSSKDEHEVEEEACIDSSVRLPKYSFSMDDFEELKKCMSLDSLIFHKLAFKGVKKICILAPKDTRKDGIPLRLLAIGSQEQLKMSYKIYPYSRSTFYRVPPLANQTWKEKQLP